MVPNFTSANSAVCSRGHTLASSHQRDLSSVLRMDSDAVTPWRPLFFNAISFESTRSPG